MARARGIARFFVHSIAVETRTGGGSRGDIFAPARTLAPATGDGVLVDDKVRLVRDKDGQEVASSGQVAGPLAVADLFTPDSKVTILNADGSPRRTARVIVAQRGEVTGLPEHVVVSLA